MSVEDWLVKYRLSWSCHHDPETQEWVVELVAEHPLDQLQRPKWVGRGVGISAAHKAAVKRWNSRGLS